jgi:hypothetical protein
LGAERVRLDAADMLDLDGVAALASGARYAAEFMTLIET